MIVSRLHNFILVKNRKVGGTSLELMLSPFMGEDDILTPLDVEFEMIRGSMGCYPRNYCLDRPLEQALKDAVLNQDQDAIRRYKMELRQIGCKFYHHMPLSEAKQFLSERFFNNAEKYAVERRPQDKILSRARSYFGKDNHSAFTSVFKATYLRPPVDLHRYTLDRRIAIDRLFFYEELDEIRRFFAEKFGVSVDDIPNLHVRRYEKAHRDDRLRLNWLEKLYADFRFRHIAKAEQQVGHKRPENPELSR